MQQKLIPEAFKDIMHRAHPKTRSQSRSSCSSSRDVLTSDEDSEYYCISEDDLPGRSHRRNDSVSTHSSGSRRSIESTPSEVKRNGRGRSVARIPLTSAQLNKPLVPPPVPEKDIAHPTEVDAQIQVAQRRTLSRSPVRAASQSRRHAVYFQSMCPQYDPISKTLVFHDPKAAVLATL